MRRPRHSAGLTLFELLISVALASALALLVMGTLVSTQEVVSDGTALQQATAKSRWIAEQIATELRDMNYVSGDVSPYVFNAVSSLQYRKISGYSSGAITLDPSRSSGSYRKLELSGTKVVLTTTNNTVVLGGRVDTLELTLVPADSGAGIANDRVRIKVVVGFTNSSGVRIQGASEVVLQLRNKVSDAT